jgi:divalent metal cation (Fe/Co/Zn/Cd) transporter
MSTVTIEPSRRRTLQRRIRVVVGITISYNVVEAIVALAAGTVASSGALIAFGLDSIVEVLSAAAVAWQFAARDPETRERVALRLIAVSFFGLAAFVLGDTLVGFLTGEDARPSVVGIVLAALSLVIMPVLSWFERRTGRELGSASAIADSKQTLLCAYLSAALLLGLALNAILGWAWADSIAALVIAGWAIKEGIEAWCGDACAVPVAALTGEREIEHDHHEAR